MEAILPDESVVRAAYATLPEWRRRKCDSLRFDADRRRAVAVWLLLRQMLVGRGVDADALSVTENDCGKPSFVTAPDIHFSLSHAGDRVMAAISDAEIGCDVERIVPIADGVLVASLSEGERTCLAALSGTVRDREFIRLWVRKESYIKAVGRGMEIEMSSFSALDAPPSSCWIWQDFDFGDGHLGCVCSHPRTNYDILRGQ